MNTILRNNYIKALTTNKIFKRLSKVTTMLPPCNKYTNRKKHTLDVVETAQEIEKQIILPFGIKNLDNFIESCYAHDLGHCCYAHETEVVVNDFIAEELHVNKNEVGFSHAINGALVFAIATKPNKKQTNFSKLSLFNKNNVADTKCIVDSIIKHSFKKENLGSIYFEFVNDEFLKIAQYSLFTRTFADDYPLYIDGYYVRVADDIASKNSDILDLKKLYFGSGLPVKKTSTNRYKMRDRFIYELKNAFSPYQKENNIEKIYESLPLFQAEKSFLKCTYNFKYKSFCTSCCQILIKEVLKLVCENPFLLKKSMVDRRLSYIKEIFIYYYSKELKKNSSHYKPKFNLKTIRYVRNKYLSSISNIPNMYSITYSKYVCAIAYEISNFTDKDLLDFADSIRSGLSNNANSCLNYLLSLK